MRMIRQREAGKSRDEGEKWDRHFEDDVKAGRLDFLVQEIEDDIASGRTRPLDGIWTSYSPPLSTKRSFRHQRAFPSP